MPEAPLFQEDSILSRFDHLVSAGIILYSENQQIVPYTHKGFRFEFRASSALISKPAFQKEVLDGKGGGRENGSCAPGSDINISGFEVADVGASHLLAFNKYSVWRPHMLLLTRDSYKRQYEPLDREDLEAAWAILSSMERDYLILFNCGEKGGCSRLHKHMQVVPYPAPASFSLFLDPEAAVEGAGSAGKNAPYLHFYHRYDAAVISADLLLEMYGDLLAKVRASLNLTGGETIQCPHNLVMTRRWMLVIPRTKARVGGAAVNAAGMLGMVTVADGIEMENWIQLGPADVLAQVGVASPSYIGG